ncbi:MAG: selenite/tellurite reduction operon protein ExtJ [Geobacteraceae bacterium]
MKKIIMKLSTMLIIAILATAAFAASSFSGKVTKIEASRVTVTVEQEIPKWVKKGQNVSALGGSPKVLEVNGKELVLRFSTQKAEKIKVDSAISISESSDDELQGC